MGLEQEPLKELLIEWIYWFSYKVFFINGNTACSDSPEMPQDHLQVCLKHTDSQRTFLSYHNSWVCWIISKAPVDSMMIWEMFILKVSLAPLQN